VKLLLTIPVLFLALAGCNLEEAQRISMSRAGVDSIAAQAPAVTWKGGLALGVTQFLASPPLEGWTVDWKDMGTSAHGTQRWSLTFRDGDTLIGVLSYRYGTLAYDPAPRTGSWIHAPERLACRLAWEATGGANSGAEVTCPVVKDFNELAWDPVQEQRGRVRKGDTVEIPFRLGDEFAGAGTTVFSDHSGLRIVGDYMVPLEPGQAGVLRWVVLASAGQPAWVDLGWGSLGESQRFTFTVIP